MLYQTFEPFIMPRKHAKNGRRVLDFDNETLKDFWARVDAKHSGLSNAKGCYIFAIRASKGIRPWYVGQTKKSFARECFRPHKRTLYVDGCNNNRSGTPLLFLLARSTPAGKFANGSVRVQELNFVEQMLIGLALGQNKELLNKRDTKFLKKLCLPGVMNSPPGKPGPAARALRITLGQ